MVAAILADDSWVVTASWERWSHNEAQWVRDEIAVIWLAATSSDVTEVSRRCYNQLISTIVHWRDNISIPSDNISIPSDNISIPGDNISIPGDNISILQYLVTIFQYLVNIFQHQVTIFQYLVTIFQYQVTIFQYKVTIKVLIVSNMCFKCWLLKFSIWKFMKKNGPGI